MSRDFGYYWLRIAIYIILSVCVGSIFYDVGTNYTAIYARGSCAAFISGFMTFMSIGGFPSFIEEMRVNTPISAFRQFYCVAVSNLTMVAMVFRLLLIHFSSSKIGLFS